MNYSFTSLIIKTQITSPFFNSLNNIQMKNSKFSKFFNSVFFGISSANIYKTVFNKILSTAFVYIDSGVTIKYRTLIERSDYGALGTSVTFDYCSFLECNAGEGYGGAIHVNTVSTNGDLYIEDSFFYKCYAKRAGGVFCINKWFNTRYTCVESCFAQESEHFLYGLTGSYRCYLNYSTIFNCGLENSTSTSVFFIENSKTCINHDNISYNRVYDEIGSSCGIKCLSTLSTVRFYIIFSNIQHNYGGYMFYLMSTNTYKFLIDELSFENNTAATDGYLIYCEKYNIEFEDCFFIRNYGNYFAPITSGLVKYILDECVFDIPKINEYFIEDDDSEWNQFNRTVDCHEFLNTRSCYSQYTGLTSWQIVILILVATFGGTFLIMGITMACIAQPRWLCPCYYDKYDSEPFCCCDNSECCCFDKYCCECCDNECCNTCCFSNNSCCEVTCKLIYCHEAQCCSKNETLPYVQPNREEEYDIYIPPSHEEVNNNQFVPSYQPPTKENIPEYVNDTPPIYSTTEKITANPYDDPTADD